MLEVMKALYLHTQILITRIKEKRSLPLEKLLSLNKFFRYVGTYIFVIFV